MKTASTALINFLNSNSQMIVAELYIINVKGSILRYTSSDMDLVYAGNTYNKFMISRESIKTSIGLQVDELKITLHPAITDSIYPNNGLSWVAGVRKGDLDGATVEIRRVFMPTWGDTSLGDILLFRGRVSDAQATRSEVNLSVKTELELLDIRLPRNMYQPQCNNTLYDQNCRLNSANFAQTFTIQQASKTVAVVNGSWAPGYFDMGSLIFNSGQNANVTRSIRWSGTVGQLLLSLPTEFDMAPGDSVTCYPGCDKTLGTCKNKFNNKGNFSGFPFIPVPETAT